jgi:hypothetical protein
MKGIKLNSVPSQSSFHNEKFAFEIKNLHLTRKKKYKLGLFLWLGYTSQNQTLGVISACYKCQQIINSIKNRSIHLIKQHKKYGLYFLF